MVTKAKKFCRTCGRERPMQLFALKHVKGYRSSICFLHSDVDDIPEEYRDLVKQEKTQRPFRTPEQEKLVKKRAARRQAKKDRKGAYVAVVHERKQKRKRLAKARVAIRPPQMTREEYATYLESDHWQEFTVAYRMHADMLHACFVCGDELYDLHHHTYARIGKELFADIVPLCRQHHRSVHSAVRAGVQLANAHTYVKMRFQKGQLGIKKIIDESIIK